MLPLLYRKLFDEFHRIFTNRSSLNTQYYCLTIKEIEWFVFQLPQYLYPRRVEQVTIFSRVFFLEKYFTNFSQTLPKVEGKFLYSAVSQTQDCSKRFTHYFPCRPVHWRHHNIHKQIIVTFMEIWTMNYHRSKTNCHHRMFSMI